MNSGTSATVKKVAKPAAKRGVYMDFAARGKKPGPVVLRPDARAARQQAARPVGTGGRPAGPDARAAQANVRIAQKKAQAEARQRALRLAKAGVPGRAPGLEGTKPQAKVTKPKAVKPASRAARPAVKQPVQPAVKQKFVAKPAAEPEPQRPLSQGRVVKQAIYEEIDFGVVEDYQSEKPATTEAKSEMVKVPEKGPNWPFLKSVTVEKRPLSGGKKVATKSRPAPAPTTVTPAASSIALNSGVAKKGSKLPMVGLILLTIILGVAVGAAVYFAIFQGGGPGDV